MAENTINAVTNADQANVMLDKALAQETVIEPAKIVAPTNIEVSLPGGYILFSGELARVAEVRELTGRDEEYIAKAGANNKVFSAILLRGTVKVGNESVTEDLLSRMLIGDREALLLGIFRATYGDTAKMGSWCSKCGNQHIVGVDVQNDIKVRPLLDPVGDRNFTVQGKRSTYDVTLPTGAAQARLLESTGATTVEASNILLEETLLRIDGKPVLSRNQILDLGLADRATIIEAIEARTPGPIFDNVTVECPDCGGELQVVVDLAAMFRF